MYVGRMLDTKLIKMPENVGLIASVRSQNLNPFKSFVSKKHKLKVKEEAKTEIIYVNS